MIRYCLLSALACFALAPGGLAQDYPTAPLAAAPPRTPHSPTAIARWLSENQDKWTPEQVVAVREDVYALIADRVRRRYAADGSQYPVKPDSLLGALFQLASRTGAIGARQVAHGILPGIVRDEPPPGAPDLELSYTPPSFRLRDTRAGWTVTFPYYFMISVLERHVLADSNEYAVVMLSTLLAPNAPPDTSQSQATILIVASPSTTPSALAAFWAQQMGVQPIPSRMANSPHTYEGFDPSAHLRKEFHVFPARPGAVGVGYIGLEGTFQVNHPHFVEFTHRLASSLAK